MVKDFHSYPFWGWIVLRAGLALGSRCNCIGKRLQPLKRIVTRNPFSLTRNRKVPGSFDACKIAISSRSQPAIVKEMRVPTGYRISPGAATSGSTIAAGRICEPTAALAVNPKKALRSIMDISLSFLVRLVEEKAFQLERWKLRYW